MPVLYGLNTNIIMRANMDTKRVLIGSSIEEAAFSLVSENVCPQRAATTVSKGTVELLRHLVCVHPFVRQAKPETELMQAPSSLQAGKDKTEDKKGKKHSRRKGGKHHKDSDRKKEKRRSPHKKCSSDSDCKHGRKCLPGKKGKICKKEF
ncbi:hypothetical protein ACTXT7_006006 [Hymenolepis weldensis]